MSSFTGCLVASLPECHWVNKFVAIVQQLASLKLTTKIDRRTFAALKLYQGVPARLIMQATGRQTEEAFNYYFDID